MSIVYRVQRANREKRIKRENVQDLTSQQIFVLEKLVFTRIS